MTPEQIFGAACASNPYSLANEPQVAGAFHEGFEQGAAWMKKNLLRKATYILAELGLSYHCEEFRQLMLNENKD